MCVMFGSLLLCLIVISFTPTNDSPRTMNEMNHIDNKNATWLLTEIKQLVASKQNEYYIKEKLAFIKRPHILTALIAIVMILVVVGM